MLKKSSNNKSETYDYMIKLIIIGDSGVGKTNILTRFCENIFKDSHVATIGVDFNVRTIQVEDKKLRLQVWDTAGQERFKTITQTYYKGAAGIFLVYSVDCRESFNNIQKWILQVNQKTSPDIKKVLIANKVDIKPEHREVLRDEGEKLAKENGLNYVQVSAKNNVKIDEMFHLIGKEIKDRLQSDQKNDLQELSRTITLSVSNRIKKMAKGSMQQPEKQGCRC